MPRPNTSVEIYINTKQQGHAVCHEQSEERMKIRIIRPRFKRGPPAYNRVTVNDNLMGYVTGISECSLDRNKIKQRSDSNSKFQKEALFILINPLRRSVSVLYKDLARTAL
jgi:hypothetical protein